MPKVCNNVDGKCYYINGCDKNPVSLNNEMDNICYLPNSCPQNCNTPYEWIFNLPTPYTTLLELNNAIAQDYHDSPESWIFSCYSQ